MLDWRLWVSFFLSLGLHLSLCLLAVGNGKNPESARYPLSVELKGKGGRDSPSLLASSGAQGVGVIRKSTQRIREEHESPTSSRIVALGDGLDELPLPIVDPIVEPEYGFADDVGGVITLSLLVNTEGRVVFDVVLSNDFDESTTLYLRQQFRSLRFSPPTSKGKPVYAWLSYVVNIRSSE